MYFFREIREIRKADFSTKLGTLVFLVKLHRNLWLFVLLDSKKSKVYFLSWFIVEKNSGHTNFKQKTPKNDQV
jgi:hypothetical protein